MAAHSLPPTLSSLPPFDGKLHVRPATPDDAIDGVVPASVIEPTSETELASALEYANSHKHQVAPRGGGTKLGWGNELSRIDLLLSTSKLNRVLEHAHHDMTVTVEAGATFAHLQQALAQHSQRLALDPLWPDKATVGGVLATNDSGSLRLRYGGARDLIIGVTVALPDGTLANSGGKVVKNVAGYDLPKLMTGALGTLGVITKAVFRLHPLPEQSRSVSIAFPDVQKANDFMLRLADSVLVPTGTQLRVAHAVAPVVDVRFEDISQSVEAQLSSLFEFAPHRSVTDTNAEIWRARENLFSASSHAAICKLSVLPSEIASMCEMIERSCANKATWSLVAQAFGLTLLRIESEGPDTTAAIVSDLRQQFSPRHGTLVLLRAKPSVKKLVDPWGPTGTAHALMCRIKQKFDSNGILNRGRFVGGI